MHFIGFSRGAVVNSEMIQRLGTFFPHAGGSLNADGTPVLNSQGQPIRDLQMTTIDPHDFAQESLKIDAAIPGSPILADFRDFHEPTVQVWENVTFADNYYQTVADPYGATWTPNGRLLEGAALNIRLDGRTGFTEDDFRGGPHNHTWTWYAGTLNLSSSEVPSVYEQPIDALAVDEVYDQLGEKSLQELLNLSTNQITLTPWYSSGGAYGSSEGIGTGWSYSILGGGKRPVIDLTKRVPVDEDNTDEDIVEGDFAVPTVFNGSFDVGLSDDPNAPVPGWSLHNGGQPLLRKYLVDVSTIPTLINPPPSSNNTFGKNLALKIGDGNPTDYIYNLLKVDDWGVLRFDVHAPVLANFDDPNSFLSVSVKDDTGNFVPLKSKNPKTYYPNFDDSGYVPNPEFPAVDLREVQVFDALTIQGQTNRIGYGQRGFEIFFVDVPAELRGASREIQFELTGAADQVAYIDNIAFQSFDLRFGMPRLNGQEARDEVNTTFNTNYLSEKPQYALSYNENTRLANWVSWHLNSTWIPDGKTPRVSFAEDISLPFPGKRVTDKDYESNKPPEEISYNRRSSSCCVRPKKG